MDRQLTRRETLTVLTAAAVGVSATGVGAAEPQKEGVRESPTRVPITLKKYWHETITHEEALKRLKGRPLTEERRARITKSIPESLRHFLSFGHSTFREYIEFPNGRALLLLQLPILHDGDTYTVVVPIFHPERGADGRLHRTLGIELHDFKLNGKSLVDGEKEAPSFTYSEEPITIHCETVFMRPDDDGGGDGGGDVDGDDCCGLCEWVHSALSIHCADPLCCGFSCNWHPH